VSCMVFTDSNSAPVMVMVLVLGGLNGYIIKLCFVPIDSCL